MLAPHNMMENTHTKNQPPAELSEQGLSTPVAVLEPQHAEEQIATLVARTYHELKFNCAQTVLFILGDFFSVSISQQIFNSAIGLNGAGRRQEQCGLVEGALMFMGIYFAKHKLSQREIVNICGRFVDEFKEKFGSISCRELRPGGFRKDDPPHRCKNLSLQSVEFSHAFIWDEAVRRGIITK